MRWTENTLAFGKRWALIRWDDELRLFVGTVRNGRAMDGTSAALDDAEVLALRLALGQVEIAGKPVTHLHEEERNT